MTIMGLMPEDAPYLTVEDAERILKEMKAQGILGDFGETESVVEIRDRFNSVATAPDMEGGSGFTIITYALDAEHVKYIQIHSGMGVLYFDGNETIRLYPKDFSLDSYSDWWSDETIREKVYEVIDNYTWVPTPRSDFGYAPENQALYDQLAAIDGAAPYILRYVLERDNGNGNACDGEMTMMAADLMGRSFGVQDDELPDDILLTSYLRGTPKYYAARLVAASYAEYRKN